MGPIPLGLFLESQAWEEGRVGAYRGLPWKFKQKVEAHPPPRPPSEVFHYLSVARVELIRESGT